MYIDEEQKPEPMSATNLAVAVVLHGLFFALLWFAGQLHFREKEIVIPMDLTVVVQDSLSHPVLTRCTAVIPTVLLLHLHQYRSFLSRMHRTVSQIPSPSSPEHSVRKTRYLQATSSLILTSKNHSIIRRRYDHG